LDLKGKSIERKLTSIEILTYPLDEVATDKRNLDPLAAIARQVCCFSCMTSPSYLVLIGGDSYLLGKGGFPSSAYRQAKHLCVQRYHTLHATKSLGLLCMGKYDPTGRDNMG
jgi:hypothetical protein